MRLLSAKRWKPRSAVLKTVYTGEDSFYLNEERRRRTGCAAIETWRSRRPTLEAK